MHKVETATIFHPNFHSKRLHYHSINGGTHRFSDMQLALAAGNYGQTDNRFKP